MEPVARYTRGFALLFFGFSTSETVIPRPLRVFSFWFSGFLGFRGKGLELEPEGGYDGCLPSRLLNRPGSASLACRG